MGVAVEICVGSVAAALAAREGGADRVELCESLPVGGTTPSAGTIALACRLLSIPVHILIRPRGGDFVYSPVEFDIMRHDIAVAKAAGASGVVLGLLTSAGHVDRERTATLIADARPMSVTFHKAFDAASDQENAWKELVALGVDRVLTSGGRPTAREGLDRLADLVRAVAGRLTILAGGGLTASDVRPLIEQAHVPEIHLGSGVCPDGDCTETRTEAALVRRIVALARES